MYICVYTYIHTYIHTYIYSMMMMIIIIIIIHSVAVEIWLAVIQPPLAPSTLESLGTLRRTKRKRPQ